MAEPKKRGRPVTGTAKTSTERGKAADAALLRSGGRIIKTMRLNADAATALLALSSHYGSDRSACEAALIEHAKHIVAANGK